MITISERNYFEPNTEVEIFMPSGKRISFTIDTIYDQELNPLEKACHPEEILKIRVPEEVEANSMMRIKVN